MSDERRADRREERHRDAVAKTARTLQDQSRKAGHDIPYSEHLRRVQRADRTRKDER